MNEAPHGLLATAHYLPRLRLDRGQVLAQHRWMAPGLRGLAKGTRAMASWDEDCVTMAVEAVRACGTSVNQVQSLTLASTSLPFAERSNAAIAASALGLPDTARVRDVVSTQRAGLGELTDALRHPAPHPTLIAAAERRVVRPASAQEMIQGDGASAALVGHGEAIATYVASHSVHADFVDHFRASGEAYDYGWEERWVRDEGYMKLVATALKACLAAADVQAGDIAHFALPAPLAKVNEAVAKRLGIQPEAIVAPGHDDAGDLGAAQSIAMLDRALRAAKPGALILVAAFGSGCDALLLRRTPAPCPGALPADGKPEPSYMKYLSFTGQLALEWGMRAEIDSKTALTAAWRDHARAARFEGGKCRQCGTVQFPRSHVCVNPDCNAVEAMDPTSLAETPARVLSHTSDFLAYTPHPPFQFGHVDFEGGGRVLMEFADADVDELSVGLPLRMVYRVKDFDALRGFRRYFWKATPLRARAGSN